LTNEGRIAALRAQLERTGDEIEAAGREPELKERARMLATCPPPEFLADVLEVDPLRSEKLCDYYIYLFASFESLKRQEQDAMSRGKRAHKKWLASHYAPTDAQNARRYAVRIAEQIAVSGVTAGLIWLGKTLIENWPLGYRFAPPADE